ncbi:hypothetical protein [Acinetobacter sp. ANC 4173]|uniref:hypothetical protein n=1 Tax=Acinetobacter sp. ANC 4173 TaxID=2529837 RepID=UPI001D0D85A8|nr:hypothetical protein [Acinetobacter sp. ANC 4173]
MDIKNSAITAKMVIHSLLALLENENVDISSVKFKVGSDGNGRESPEFELEKLVSLAIDGLVEIEEANAVPEGFVLVPTEKVKYFSHDGENYEIHDTLSEAKHEAECAIENFSERLADQLCDPRSDGNFQDVGYGVILAQSGYSIDHIVTQEDIDNEDYSYEVGTEILSLFLVEAQEQSHD